MSTSVSTDLSQPEPGQGSANAAAHKVCFCIHMHGFCAAHAELCEQSLSLLVKTPLRCVWAPSTWHKRASMLCREGSCPQASHSVKCLILYSGHSIDSCPLGIILLLQLNWTTSALQETSVCSDCIALLARLSQVLFALLGFHLLSSATIQIWLSAASPAATFCLLSSITCIAELLLHTCYSAGPKLECSSQAKVS